MPSASLPSDHTAGAWVAFGDAQTGQLDKANSRTLDTIEIISTCEARDAAVQQSLTPKPWWRVW